MRRRPILTVPAYFALEAAEQEHRHEYWDGDIWAMTGTSPEHNDLSRQLDDQLAGKPCHAYMESIRTRISATKYVYPDVVAACPPDFDRGQSPPILTNPKLIIEVLSESTASFDRGDKLAAYQAVETITDILLVSSLTFDTVHYTRTEGGWLMRRCAREAAVMLDGLDATLNLDAAYRAAGL